MKLGCVAEFDTGAMNMVQLQLKLVTSRQVERIVSKRLKQCVEGFNPQPVLLRRYRRAKPFAHCQAARLEDVGERFAMGVVEPDLDALPDAYNHGA